MKHSGFSLIELMIVVAIIAFLASIAIPKYFKYYAKARQAEVSVLLASLHTAQQAYWAEHGEYKTELAGPNGILPHDGHVAGRKRVTRRGRGTSINVGHFVRQQTVFRPIPRLGKVVPAVEVVAFHIG